MSPGPGAGKSGWDRLLMGPAGRGAMPRLRGKRSPYLEKPDQLSVDNCCQTVAVKYHKQLRSKEYILAHSIAFRDWCKIKQHLRSCIFTGDDMYKLNTWVYPITLIVEFDYASCSLNTRRSELAKYL